eukprot:215707-Prymnesium_polylepis.1
MLDRLHQGLLHLDDQVAVHWRAVLRLWCLLVPHDDDVDGMRLPTVDEVPRHSWTLHVDGGLVRDAIGVGEILTLESDSRRSAFFCAVRAAVSSRSTRFCGTFCTMTTLVPWPPSRDRNTAYRSHHKSCRATSLPV